MGLDQGEQFEMGRPQGEVVFANIATTKRTPLMPNVIQFPEPVNKNRRVEPGEADLAGALAAFGDIVRKLVAGLRCGDVAFAEAEVELLSAIQGLGCFCARELARAVVPYCEFLEVEGDRYGRLKGSTMGHYRGLHGGFSLKRRHFRKLGEHNGPTIDPVAVCAGMVEETHTPAAAVAAAHLLQLAPSREGAELAESFGVMPWSRSNLLRCGVAVGRRWHAIRAEAETVLADEFEVPEDAVAVSAAVDRVSLPMSEERERTASDVAKGIKRPVTVAFRMAYCAVWTLHDAGGRSLHSVRYAWLPTEGKSGCIDVLASDLRSLHRSRPDLQIVTLADGAPEMHSILDQAVDGLPVTAQLVDYWHLVEKLGAAAKAMDLQDESPLSRWKGLLLDSDTAIDEFDAELIAWKGARQGPLPEVVHNALTYIENQRERLRYATARASKLPIGSGHVEATCKTIVTTRMQQPGARWKTEGARAVLHLRALATSSRWREAMSLVTSSYRYDTRSCAA